jgi:hypothetical protein
MNSETYLKHIQEGSLIDRLKFMAKEYDGPCGQSSTVMAANAAKKANLLEAIKQETELKEALQRMCEYANHLGNEVLVKLGNANYAGDFVKQWEHLLKGS